MPLKLPRLTATTIVDKDGKPAREFTRFWDQAMSAIESGFNSLADAVAAIAAAQAAAAAAQATADAAQTTASTAQATAEAAQSTADDAVTAAGGVNSYASLANSYPLEDCLIQAVDAGSDGTISISTHTRRYGDGTEVGVDGASITGLAYNTSYWIYYDDTARAGGTVSYSVTTGPSYTDAFQSATNPDRHFVGVVNTPAALGAPEDGDRAQPPGSPV